MLTTEIVAQEIGVIDNVEGKGIFLGSWCLGKTVERYSSSCYDGEMKVLNNL